MAEYPFGLCNRALCVYYGCSSNVQSPPIRRGEKGRLFGDEKSFEIHSRADLFFTGSFQPGQPIANIQIIHNCADTTLDTIDLYYNGVVVDSPMLFRTVFPGNGLYPVTADAPVTITIAHKHSNGNPADSFRTFYIDSFAANQRYAIFISGVFDTASYAANPGSRNTSLNLAIVGNLDSIASSDSVAAFKFFQGATDLDTLQALERLSRQLLIVPTVYDSIPGAAYTALDSLHHQLWEFQLFSPDTLKNYGTYEVDLTNDEEQTFVMFTSGFLNPSANDSGPVLGLFGVFLNGSIVQFPVKTAAFQLLHNSPDPALDSVDVYINGSIAYPAMPFRTATPAITEYAYGQFSIGIKQKDSTAFLWDSTLTFQPDTFYIATMQGELIPANYSTNPDGISRAFTVLMKSPAEYSSSSGFNFDFFMVNGVPDAGPLYLVPQGGPALCDSVVYNAQTNYVSLPSEFYTLSLTDNTGSTLGTSFANFPAFSGQSAVLLASGFLNPGSNNNGPSLGLYLSPIAGGPFIPLFPYTGIASPAASSGTGIFPNPADDVVFIRSQESVSHVRIYDLRGQLITESHSRLPDGQVSSGAENEVIPVDVSHLSNGIYLLQVSDDDGIANYRLVIAR